MAARNPTKKKAGKRSPSPASKATSTPAPKRDWKSMFTDLGAAETKRSRSALKARVEHKVVHEDKSVSGYIEILAFADGDRVGYAYVEGRDSGELNLAMVFTDWRYEGQRIGRGLVAQVEAYARANGFETITGEVNQNDYTTTREKIERRAGWFKLLGFEVTEDGAQYLISKKL